MFVHVVIVGTVSTSFVNDALDKVVFSESHYFSCRPLRLQMLHATAAAAVKVAKVGGLRL